MGLKPRKENNMLFRYNNKVYVRPFANKLVEVNVSKIGNEYDVKPTNTKLEITSEVNEGLYSISIEEAYNIQNPIKINKKFK